MICAASWMFKYMLFWSCAIRSSNHCQYRLLKLGKNLLYCNTVFALTWHQFFFKWQPTYCQFWQLFVHSVVLVTLRPSRMLSPEVKSHEYLVELFKNVRAILHIHVLKHLNQIVHSTFIYFLRVIKKLYACTVLDLTTVVHIHLFSRL